MAGRKKIFYGLSGVFFLLFAALTAALCFIDVGAIGPEGSEVGFATLNDWFRTSVGFSETWYNVTEVTGAVTLAVAAGFAVFGLLQLIRRRSFKKVDRDLYVLAGFYVVVVLFYVAFEIVTVNYRPVLLEEGLESSYPSSHTMLDIGVMTTAILQLCSRVKNRVAKFLSCGALGAVGLVTVVGRALSGVHWLTDIVGGVLLSVALVLLYCGAVAGCERGQSEKE